MDTVQSRPRDLYRSIRSRYRMSRRERITAWLLGVGIVLLVLIPFTFFIVPAGHVGVLYRLLTTGTETAFVFPEGLGIKWPWNRVHYYDVRTQARDDEVHGLANDGLSLEVDVTIQFRPVVSMVGALHREIGPDYVERVVRPAAIGAIRTVVGQYGPHLFYRTGLHLLEQQVLDQLRLASSPTGLVEYQGVVLRNVTLPQVLNEAITRKLAEEQNAQAYEYLIVQAEQEAARKRVEAIGIQTFYSIVANALSPQLLTWRGIEATVQLARSNNAKIVVIGSGRDQMPLILGSDIAGQPALPAPPAIQPGENPLPSFDDLPRLFPDSGAGTRTPRTRSNGVMRSLPGRDTEGTASLGEPPSSAAARVDPPNTGVSQDRRQQSN